MSSASDKPFTRAHSGIERVCVLTAGGDAPGLNAVVRAIVKTGTELGLELLGSEDGFEGLIQGDRVVDLQAASVRGILPRGGSILGCSTRANPFAYPSRDAQGKETVSDVSERVLQTLKRYRIDALIVVGGDGPLGQACDLAALGVKIVAVPKTIDDDLAATDLTFGFNTAVATATWAIDALHATAEAQDRVMLIELMGRSAGWIALHAGIAGGAAVVLLPELPYDLERVVEKVKARAFSIIVVGEGARPKDGTLGSTGAANQLAQLLEGRLPHEVRTSVLGHLQRGGSPTAFDRLLGTRFGVEAARLCARGETGRLVTLRGQSITSVPLADAVHRPKLVPLDGELVSCARAVGIELGG